MLVDAAGAGHLEAAVVRDILRPPVPVERYGVGRDGQTLEETALDEAGVFLVTGETSRGAEAVTEPESGLVELPYWLYLLVC